MPPTPKQATAFTTKPTAAACGSCHDNVNFTTGVNHLGGPQANDNQCANCHIPQGESDFDASILGAHVNPNQSSLLPGIQGKILSVTKHQAGPESRGCVSRCRTAPAPPFRCRPSRRRTTAWRSYSPVRPPTTSAINAHGYISEDASKKSVLSGDTYTYTFSTAIPADATGTYTIGMEGRRYDTVLAGTTKAQTIEYGMKNVVYNFSVDGSAVKPRRAVVALSKCDSCHWNLSLHGENRNQIEQCVLVPQPGGERQRLPSGRGQPDRERGPSR